MISIGSTPPINSHEEHGPFKLVRNMWHCVHGKNNYCTNKAPNSNMTQCATVAKKKRELFSARSSRSGGSGHSSASVSDSKDHSHLYKVLLICQLCRHKTKVPFKQTYCAQSGVISIGPSDHKSVEAIGQLNHVGALIEGLCLAMGVLMSGLDLGL